MNGIKHYCNPREDLLKGTFNPEIFTPSLSAVLSKYAGEGKTETIYTDGELFFKEATYPSDRLAQVTKAVFRRLGGDSSFGATHRLETSFGGGKTHALIALAHLSQRGTDLTDAVSDWFPADLLSAPGEVKLVGLVGERMKVTDYQEKSEGEPWTLWREIAYQVDPKLADQPWAKSKESPEDGGPWFQNVLEGKKVLILLDELAVYATRLYAARPSEVSQIGTFLKTLFDFARSRSGIVTVLTLASVEDAFKQQTEEIRKAVAEGSGKELKDVSDVEAERMMRESTGDLESVIKRDEDSRPILSPEELAKVFSKRLFEKIDSKGAETAAKAFADIYSSFEADLPGEANTKEMQERMQQCYPFHPTFIDFLYEKLSSVENFQGTRGVLQTMSVVIHRLWAETKVDPIMIQVGDIDLRGERVNDMLLSRTKSLDLEPALSTDIGGLKKGEQHAARLDRENENPAEPHWHEKVWRVVFLNSLSGRKLGLESKLFGITEPDALLQCVHPSLKPALVQKALAAIEDEAWYLKFREGRYYCDLNPTIARIVRSVKDSLRQNESGKKEVNAEIANKTRRLLKDSSPFKVFSERVKAPSDLPDEQEQPTVVVIDHTAGTISLQDFFTQTGRGARSHQNPLIFLVPDSVSVKEKGEEQTEIFDKKKKQLDELTELALDVLARRKIAAKPSQYQLKEQVLKDDDFDGKLQTKDGELRTQVAKLYSTYWYAAYDSGSPTSSAHSAVAAESGMDIFPTIEKRLKDRNKLLNEENSKHKHLRLEVAKQIFKSAPIRRLKEVAESFWKDRRWPMLASSAVLGPLIRAGLEDEQWVLVYQDTLAADPTKVYSKKQPLPFDVHASDLWEDKGYTIVQTEEARKRGWLDEKKKVDFSAIITKSVSPDRPANLDDFRTAAKKELPEDDQSDAAVDVVVRDGLESGSVVLVESDNDFSQPDDKPTRVIDTPMGASGVKLEGKNIFIVRKDLAQERGWLNPDAQDDTFSLEESHFEALHGKLPKFGVWSRGMNGRLTLEMEDVKLAGQDVRITFKIEDADEAAVQEAQELLEVFSLHTEPDADADALVTLKLTNAEECPFAQKLRDEIENA